MMYALLAGRYPEERYVLMEKADRIFKFVKAGQNSDGSRFYHADNGKGNFIDCFHSCFVLKNIIKYGQHSSVNASAVVNKGMHYLLGNFLDYKYFLVKKFTVSAHPSVVKFDLYDQAEFLNVLILLEYKKLAEKLYDSIIKHFYIPAKQSFGYQIDVFGKLNKIVYLRWAVMPMIYALSE